MIEQILSLYHGIFPFEKFYDNLLYNIKTYPQHHIVNPTFLKGYNSQVEVSHDIPTIYTKEGDIRVDLPIWFGDFNTDNKIIILGLEPRDTDQSGHLNIERIDNFVFGTPFALERPKGPYYSAFQDIITANKGLIYFTDVVKTYHVSHSTNKSANDKEARTNFWTKAEEGKSFLSKEIESIKPKKIIGLGNHSYHFLQSHFGDKYKVHKIRHPSQGGTKLAKEQLKSLLLN